MSMTKTSRTPKASPMGGAVTPRAAIYTRVSTDEQAESGLGLAVQEERARALAIARGWTVTGIYADEGVSGTIDPRSRAAASRLLADVEAHRVDVVVVFKLDRLSRRAEWIHRTLRELDHAGAALTSVSEPVDTSSSMGKAFIGITAVFAELERDLIADRTKAAMAELRRQGRKTGGRVPFGSDVLEDGHLVPNVDEQETLGLIRRLREEGRTLRAIAAELEARGIRTKTGGSTWAPKVLADVLGRVAA